METLFGILLIVLFLPTLIAHYIVYGGVVDKKISWLRPFFFTLPAFSFLVPWMFNICIGGDFGLTLICGIFGVLDNDSQYAIVTYLIHLAFSFITLVVLAFGSWSRAFEEISRGLQITITAILVILKTIEIIQIKKEEAST